MNAEFWEDVILRISKRDAVNIDDVAGPTDPRRNPVGKGVFPDGIHTALAELPFKTEEMGAIGFRITEPRDDIPQAAFHLAMLAMEHEVDVIVLAHLDYCGLERFGFRCERITGDTPKARSDCEQQIRRFWNIDLVL
ncbi:hypothetical protein [Rhodophyticola sp.]|jgi:hypothetical protein|uniref:hypothetical protein n=1 Tax=Rhodophyticola sp. TaxID=2680032 RepID=UPI003D2BADF5